MSGQSGGYRLRLSTLNEQLTCKLCGGYFVDATTIIECLHSFCRSCIVKYLESNKYCPICEVQVHKSKPLLNIRPDHTLQDIVYKLVPGCYQNEMRCRREFYANHPDTRTSVPTPESRGDCTESHIYSADESLSLSLEYYNPCLTEETVEDKEATPQPLPRRYLRCPAAVTIFHLQKLIRAKYGLSDVHRVDIMYKEEVLCGSYTLMDVMYIYHWRRKVPLHLSYRIFESSAKRLKLSEDNSEYKQTLSNTGIGALESKGEQAEKREWKEVQLKISETGVMSVTDISSLDTKKSTKNSDDNVDEEKRLAGKIDNVEDVNKSNIQSKPATRSQDSIKLNTEASKKVTASITEVTKNCRDIAAAEESRKPSESLNAASKNLEKDISPSSTKSLEPISLKRSEGETQTPGKVAKPGESDKTKSGQIQKASQQIQNAVQPTKTEVEPVPSKDKNSDSRLIPTNNNVISPEGKAENQRPNARNANAVSGTGSKIDALSAKLQFQPKVGQVNNTYSKKTPKEKKSVAQSLKKQENKASVDGTKCEARTPTTEATNTKTRASSGLLSAKTTSSPPTVPASRATNSSVVSTQTTNTFVTTPHTSCLFVTSSQPSMTYVTSPSVSMSGIQSSSATDKSSSNQTLSFRQNNNNLAPTNQSLASIGLSVSTSIPSLGHIVPSFPYAVQNLVSGANKNAAASQGRNSSTTNKLSHSDGQDSSVTVTGSEGQTSTVQQFSTQTPSMSIYSITTSTKSSPHPSTMSQNTPVKQTTAKGGLEITSVYSVPPCPDAIPISLMKPTVRKHEIIAKGTNVNEICAKIGTSGSKINDICAKIGENSKEKNRTEARSRPEIPDLLKIAKKGTTDPVKHTSGIPNVPTYIPVNSANPVDNKTTCPNKDTSKNVSAVSSQAVPTVQASQKAAGAKKLVQATVYKTLRDPPKSWNPTLSQNNYVAAKNQAKEMRNQPQAASTFEPGPTKSIASKPAKIFKMRNMPRYLGNPASGVKPMYGVANEVKDKDQAMQKNSSLNMMKIDPKTLSPIVSTANSPIVSPPPYSPGARSYQNASFSREMCRSTGSPISPRNSPVNMLSTNPFIPSPTPNTNPRLFFSHYPPPFPDASRFPNPLIRSPIGIPPHSAFHNSLPPTIDKLYPRSSYLPQTTSYSTTQPPAVQRIPPTGHSSPKSPKTSTPSASSMFNLAKTETQTSIPTTVENIALHLAKTAAQQEINAFNLSKTANQVTTASDFSKTSQTASTDSQAKQHSPSTSNRASTPLTNQGDGATTTVSRSKPQLGSEIPGTDTDSARQKSKEKDTSSGEQVKDVRICTPDTVNSDDKANSQEAKPALVTKEKSSPKVNGDATIPAHPEKSKEDSKTRTTENSLEAKDNGSSGTKEKQERTDKNAEANKSLEKTNETAAPGETVSEDLTKTSEQIQGKKSETQRNKAES